MEIIRKTYYERYCNNPNEDLKSLIVMTDVNKKSIYIQNNLTANSSFKALSFVSSYIKSIFDIIKRQ